MKKYPHLQQPTEPEITSFVPEGLYQKLISDPSLFASDEMRIAMLKAAETFINENDQDSDGNWTTPSVNCAANLPYDKPLNFED